MELDPHYFLVGNNCVASHCNRLLHVPHPSPFAWAFQTPSDFERMAGNWDDMDWSAGPEFHKIPMSDMLVYYGGEFSPMPRDFFWEGVWHDGGGKGYRVLYPHIDLDTERGRDTIRRRTDRMLSLMAGGAVPHFCLSCDKSASVAMWDAGHARAFGRRGNASVVWFGDTQSLGGLCIARGPMTNRLLEKGVIHA